MGQVHYSWRDVKLGDLARHSGLILLAAPAEPAVRVEERTIGGWVPRAGEGSPELPSPPPEPPVAYPFAYDRFLVVESLTPPGRDRVGTIIEVPSASNDESRRQAQDWARRRLSNHPIYERFRLEPEKGAVVERPSPRRRRGRKRRGAAREVPAVEANPAGPRILFLDERPAPLRSPERGDRREPVIEYAFGSLTLPVSRRAELYSLLPRPEPSLPARVWRGLRGLWRGCP